MTVLRAFAIIIASGVFFSLAGGLLGLLLGMAVPGYYRAVFRHGNEPLFNPVEVGAGLGATQGLPGGVIVGVLVVFAVAWYNSRQRQSFIHSEASFVSSPAGIIPTASSAIANRRASLPSPGRADTPIPPANPAPRE